MNKVNKFEIVTQSEVTLVKCPDTTVREHYEPQCFLILRELEGKVWRIRDYFKVLLRGDDALWIYEEGQKVEVDLRFLVKGSYPDCHQEIIARSIKLIND